MSGWWITVHLITTVFTASALVLIILRLNLCLQSRKTRSVIRRQEVQIMVDTRLASTGVLKPVPAVNGKPEGVPQIPVKTSETGNTTARARNNRSEPGASNGSPGGSKAKSTRARPIPVKPDDDYYDVSDEADSREMDTVVTSELVDERDRESGLELDDRIEAEVR